MGKVTLGTKSSAAADNGLKLSKTILLANLECHPTFQNLYPIKDDVLERIKNDMKNHGFQKTSPIICWKVTDDDGTVHHYIIDGYTRRKACMELGIDIVPYSEEEYENEEAAKKHAIHLQVDRRNLESADYFRNVSILLGTEFIQNAPNKAEAIAEELNISKRQVEKVISNIKTATPEQTERILNGEATNREIYNENHPKKKKNDEFEVDTSVNDKIDDFDDLTDALEDTDGNPAPVTVHQRAYDDTPHPNPPKDSELDRWTIEKNIQIETVGKEKYAKGLEVGFYFAIAEMMKGRSAEDIFSDERFSDFSPSVVCNFVLPADDEEIISELLNK